MSSTHIKFIPEKQIITIDDEAKTMHYVFAVFAIIQIFSNGLQVYSRWGDFESKLFYGYCFLTLIFIGFAIFYLFIDSFQKQMRFNEVKYYAEKPFLWIKLRYFKLKNNKIRMINFSMKSTAPQDLKTCLKKYQISIKS